MLLCKKTLSEELDSSQFWVVWVMVGCKGFSVKDGLPYDKNSRVFVLFRDLIVRFDEHK